MTKEKAQTALDRRAAAAAIAGAALGVLPLLWLIREALLDYGEALSRRRAVEREHLPLILLIGDFWLIPYAGSNIVVRKDALGPAHYYDAPGGALVLHDAVKDDPVKAERLLVAIESATRKGLR